MKAAFEPRVDKGTFAVDYGIRRPFPLLPRLLDPLFRLWLDLIKSYIHVCRNTGHDFVCLVEETTRVDELYGVECPSTGITLITARILGASQLQGR